MTLDIVLIIVLIINIYLLTGIAAINISTPTNLFKNPLHRIWMLLFWPITIMVRIAYRVCIDIKDYIEEVKEYYKNKKDD